MNDIRDAFLFLFVSNAALVIGAIFHAFASTVMAPVAFAFIITASTFYAASAFALALGLASAFVGIRGLRK